MVILSEDDDLAHSAAAAKKKRETEAAETIGEAEGETKSNKSMQDECGPLEGYQQL